MLWCCRAVLARTRVGARLLLSKTAFGNVFHHHLEFPLRGSQSRFAGFWLISFKQAWAAPAPPSATPSLKTDPCSLGDKYSMLLLIYCHFQILYNPSASVWYSQIYSIYAQMLGFVCAVASRLHSSQLQIFRPIFASIIPLQDGVWDRKFRIKLSN